MKWNVKSDWKGCINISIIVIMMSNRGAVFKAWAKNYKFEGDINNYSFSSYCSNQARSLIGLWFTFVWEFGNTCTAWCFVFPDKRNKKFWGTKSIQNDGSWRKEGWCWDFLTCNCKNVRWTSFFYFFPSSIRKERESLFHPRSFLSSFFVSAQGSYVESQEEWLFFLAR